MEQPPAEDLKPMVSLPFVLAPLDKVLTPEEGGSATAASTGSSSTPPKKSRRGLIIAVVAVVVVLLGLGTGFLLVRTGVIDLGGNGEPSTPATANTAPPSVPPSAPPTPPTTPPSEPGGSQSPSTTGVELPTSTALGLNEFVVPRGDSAHRGFYLSSVDGSIKTSRLAAPKPGRFFAPGVSPDRRTLVYVAGDPGVLRVMAADGSGDRALFDEPPAGCGKIGHVSWSPVDVNVLVVQCDRPPAKDRMLVIDLTGRVIRELKTGAVRIEDPTISPDGQSVAFWTADVANGLNGGSLFVMPIDGSGAPTRLTNRKLGSDADPAFSPDGSQIAFRRRITGNNTDVLLMNADGTNVRALVTGAAEDEKPIWSPDGSKLMIISNRNGAGKPTKTLDLFLVNPDGSGLKRLGLGSFDMSTPVWYHR